MKVGGNGSASEFFMKHGGSALLADSDTKKKYSGRVAELYKEELAKRVKEDITRFPARIYVEGMPDVTSSADAAAANNEDDFFSSWDKPAAAKSSTPSTPTSPPVVGRSSPLGNSAAPTAPRTVTSSSLRSSSASSSRPASKLGASRLNSSSSVASTATAPAAKKTKLGGLGAKKAASPLDFAEAERKAAEEAERIKQLGYDRLKEEEEERARAKKAEEELKNSRSLGVGKTDKNNSTAPAVVSKPRGNAQDMERLGMGMKKMGFGSVPAPAAPASSSRVDDAPTAAREKFGNQKAISSDMYFGRNDYDPHVVNEAQGRLQSFQGASSISSNQYFGREEEEDEGRPMSADGLLGDGSFGNLEVAAKDAIARVMANPDVQNVGESIRAGALKFSDYLAQMSER